MADEMPQKDEAPEQDEVTAEEPEQTGQAAVGTDGAVESDGAGEAEAAPEESAGSSEDSGQRDSGDNAGPAPEPAAGGQAAPAGQTAPDMSPEELEEARANEVAFSWQASEFVHHHKGPGWYAALFGGLAVLVLAAVLLHLWIETGLFVVMGVAVVVYARKPPRTLTYELTPKGVTIEGKQYLFTEFRSFGVLKDEEWHTIDLEPIKRLAPRLSILYDPEDYDSVVGHLELHLPRADRDPDPIEKLSRYLRF